MQAGSPEFIPTSASQAIDFSLSYKVDPAGRRDIVVWLCLAAFQQEFDRATGARYENLSIEQVQIDAKNRQDQLRTLRRGAGFSLVTLALYVVAVIFEIFLLFL